MTFARRNIVSQSALPDSFRDVDHLEDVMTTPSQQLIADLEKVEGDILVLGVGGKMGPTLARLAKRAAPQRRVVGVARFSEKGLREKLSGWGIESLEADLLDRQRVAALPRLPNVIFMAGMKFGSAGQDDLIWAMNAHVPAVVAENFVGSRIVAYSTGCVYPYMNVLHGGPTELTPATPPPGAYANSCAAREKIFQYFSRVTHTPGRIIRLNYAIDMRYGVLFDVASRVFNKEALDLCMGHVNVIWQGDANSMVLRSLAHCTTPSSPLNVSGPEIVSIRWLAHTFGRKFGIEPILTGTEAPDAWLNNSAQAFGLFGYPTVPLARLIDWTADWVSRRMPSLGKDTKFDRRDGTF